jgi:hypothetical protein
MSAAQVVSLFLMFFVAIGGVLFFLDGNLSRKSKTFLVAWTIFWGFPPLAVLWIKGVFG